MNEVSIIDIVIEQCTDLEGFLVKLHSYNEFDDVKFGALSKALREYAEIIKDRENVNRRVAGCLLALSQELEIKLSQRTRRNEDFYKTIEQAHVTVTQLIDEIIPT